MMRSSSGGTSGFSRTTGVGRVQNGFEDDRRTLATEGQHPCCHFVQHSAKGEQIATRIQFFRPRLLRRHIRYRAERRTGAGEMIRARRTRFRVKSRNLARRTGCDHDLRQSEVQNLGVAALGDKDVRWFDVAVDYALCVSSIQCVGDLDGQRQNYLGFHRSPADAMLQRYAIQKLHGDERLSVLLANVVDRTDIGVIQRGRSLRFTLKAGERLWVSGNIIGKELESDEAMQSRVLSLVDHTHPAATELLYDAVVRDGLANHWREILRLLTGQVNERRGFGAISKGWLAKNLGYTQNSGAPGVSTDLVITSMAVGHYST